jgi:hypothetical protein
VTVLPVAEALDRITVDRGLLLDLVRPRAEADLVAPYLVDGRPLGDFCESLRDLVAHVLMWDEINLAVLAEARAGRRHWSLDPRWEQPEVGALLNRSGVAAGLLLPVDLLVHRFDSVRAALLAEIRQYDDLGWAGPAAVEHERASSVGALAQYVMTVPGVTPYAHARYHLGKLAA